MFLITRSFVVIILLILMHQSLADELIIIQSISNTKKTFAIRKGRIDDVVVGQDSLFTTPKFSIVAHAIEVTRNFSVWQVPYTYATVPFSHHEYVVFNENVENVWTTIASSKKQFIEGDIARELKGKRAILQEKSLCIKGAISQGLYESISQVGSNKSLTRTGYQVEGMYYNKFFHKFEFGLGIRYEQEATKNTNPSITIYSSRYFLTAEFVYHFNKIKKSKNNFYTSLGASIGKSSTIVYDKISSGNATILPTAKLGFQIPLEKNALLLEAVLESLTTSELFQNNTEQTSNVIVGRVGVGFKF